MKPNDAGRRIRRWNASARRPGSGLDRASDRYRHAVEQGFVKPRADGDQAAQVAGFSAAMARVWSVDTMARQALCEEGVPPALFLPYFSFTRQVDALQRKFSGPTLVRAVRQAFDRWVCQGLAPGVLTHILETVFSLSWVERTEPAEQASK